MEGVKNIIASIIDKLASAIWNSRKEPAEIQKTRLAGTIMIPIAIEDKVSYL